MHFISCKHRYSVNNKDCSEHDLTATAANPMFHLMKLTKVSLDEPLPGSVGVSLRSSFLARWTRIDTLLC